MTRAGWHLLFFATTCTFVGLSYAVETASWALATRIAANVLTGLLLGLVLAWLYGQRAIIARPAVAGRLNGAALTVLLVVALVAFPGPFYVPQGQAWTLPVQVLATLTLSLPAAALLVWLNGRLPPPKG